MNYKSEAARRVRVIRRAEVTSVRSSDSWRYGQEGWIVVHVRLWRLGKSLSYAEQHQVPVNPW